MTPIIRIVQNKDGTMTFQQRTGYSAGEFRGDPIVWIDIPIVDPKGKTIGHKVHLQKVNE